MAASHIVAEKNDIERLAIVLDVDPTSATADRLMARTAVKGFPIEIADRLSTILVRYVAVGEIVPEAVFQIARRDERHLPREHSQRLYEIVRVVAALSRIYGRDDSKIRSFLDRPHPLLGNVSPLTSATSGSAGAETVLDLIRRAEAGIAA